MYNIKIGSKMRICPVNYVMCSLITESKHIKAVKEPWQQSSQNEPLGQMLLTNQLLDKLAAAHVDFEACRMLDRSLSYPAPQPPPPPDDLDLRDVEGITLLGDVRLAKQPGTFH
jgi:hypothetical protein